MSERYQRDNQLEETFDKDYVKHVESRKRKAQIRKAQQAKNNFLICVVGGAIIVVLIIILIACASCSAGSDETTTTPDANNELMTSEVPTTEMEETTLVSMYTTDVLNLRAEPNTKAEIIIQIGAGKRVEVISEEGKWIKVKRGKDEGYVMKKYLSYMNTLD